MPVVDPKAARVQAMRQEGRRLMVSQRRLATATVAALVVIAALPNPALLRIAALTAVALLAAGYAMWLANRGKWNRHEQPAAAPDIQQAEIIAARLGEPTDALAPFVLQTQHALPERWHGEEPLWRAVSDDWLWLLHGTLDGGVGGVKSCFSGGGLHTRASLVSTAGRRLVAGLSAPWGDTFAGSRGP